MTSDENCSGQLLSGKKGSQRKPLKWIATNIKRNYTTKTIGSFHGHLMQCTQVSAFKEECFYVVVFLFFS